MINLASLISEYLGGCNSLFQFYFHAVQTQSPFTMGFTGVPVRILRGKGSTCPFPALERAQDEVTSEE